jgi:hypothetical protein
MTKLFPGIIKTDAKGATQARNADAERKPWRN